MSIAAFIDHTILKPTTSSNDIKKICNEAAQYRFATVCVPPFYVPQAARQLQQTGVGITTVLGFPFGYTYVDAKCKEATEAIAAGATELDMVINLGALKNGDDAYLEQEAAAISGITKKEGIVLKIIIESGILSDEEIIRCCNIYRKFDIDFLKTSTGYAEKGASVAAVQLMRQHLPSYIEIKASGGIKTYAFAKELIDAGATRLGCSASVAIVNDEPAAASDY